MSLDNSIPVPGGEGGPRQYSDTVLDISQPPFDAPRLGEGDGTTAVQEAVSEIAGSGGTIKFPYMVEVTDTIDATHGQYVRFESTKGAGMDPSISGIDTGGLYGRTGGSPIIDTTGAQGYEFNCKIQSDDGSGANHPNVGILAARSTNKSLAFGHTWGPRFEIEGKYTVAGIYNVSKESCVMYSPTALVQGGEVIHHTTTNDLGVTSPYRTIDPVDSLTNWVYVRPWWFSTTDAIMTMEGKCNGHRFIKPFFRMDSGPGIVLDTSAGGTSVPGRIRLSNPAGEGAGGPMISSAGLNDIRGIDVYRPRYSATSPAIDISGAGRLLFGSILDDDSLTYELPTITNVGLESRGQATFNVNGDAIQSRVQRYDLGGGGFTATGSIDSTTVNGVGREAAGSGASPTATSWDVAQLVENTSDNTLWIKTTAGTMVQLG